MEHRPPAQGRGARRPRRLLGERRDRGLAVSDGHAEEGRPSERSAECRGRARGECLGSGQGRSRRRAVPRVRRRRRHACAWTNPHHVAGRQHVEGGDGSGHPDEAVAVLRPPAADAGPPAWQGSSAGQLGIRRRPPWAGAGRRPQSGDDAHASRVPAEERRPVQCECGVDRVLRPHDRKQRRLLADSHRYRRGSAVSDRPLRPQHSLQTAAGQQLGVGTGAVLGTV